MESVSDSMPNLREKDSTALSTENDSASVSHKSQQPVLSPASTVQNEQSNDAILDQIKDSLNGADERFSITFSDDYLAQIKSLNALIQKLRGENEVLKVKQAVSVEKDKRLEVYQASIDKLRKECSEKDKQLFDNARLIEFLRAKDVENKKLLTEKDVRLIDKSNFIEELQAESVKNKEQLQSKSSEIDKLQETCNNKDSELVEKVTLIEKLQADCAEKDKQAKATLDRLKDLGNSMHDSGKLVSALWICGVECFKQKQYIEALLYYDNTINLEKATQSRSNKLAVLFSNKAGCHNRLKQYQQAIDAASIALQYDSNDKYALNDRAWAYINLKQYSNARQDYEKALQLDPSYELARKNLKLVQDLINSSSSQ